MELLHPTFVSSCIFHYILVCSRISPILFKLQRMFSELSFIYGTFLGNSYQTHAPTLLPHYSLCLHKITLPFTGHFEFHEFQFVFPHRLELVYPQCRIILKVQLYYLSLNRRGLRWCRLPEAYRYIHYEKHPTIFILLIWIYVQHTGYVCQSSHYTFLWAMHCYMTPALCVGFLQM